MLTRFTGAMLAGLVLASGQAGGSRAGAACATITADNIDDCVRLNEIQVLGTHNSYHLAPVTRTSLAWGGAKRVRSQTEHKGPFNKKARISAGLGD